MTLKCPKNCRGAINSKECDIKIYGICSINRNQLSGMTDIQKERNRREMDVIWCRDDPCGMGR